MGSRQRQRQARRHGPLLRRRWGLVLVDDNGEKISKAAPRAAISHAVIVAEREHGAAHSLP